MSVYDIPGTLYAVAAETIAYRRQIIVRDDATHGGIQHTDTHSKTFPFSFGHASPPGARYFPRVSPSSRYKKKKTNRLNNAPSRPELSIDTADRTRPRKLYRNGIRVIAVNGLTRFRLRRIRRWSLRLLTGRVAKGIPPMGEGVCAAVSEASVYAGRYAFCRRTAGGLSVR